MKAELGEKVKVKEKPILVPTVVVVDDDAGDKKQEENKSGFPW